MWKIVWVFGLLASAVQAKPVTIDRVILKVNDSTYTQRDLEIYLLVKALAVAQSQGIATENNWQDSVQRFKTDMLAYEETFKLRYASSSKIADAELAKVRTLITASKELNDLSQRLVIADKDIEQSLIMLERIQKYNKEQKESVESQGIPHERRVPLAEKRNFVRIFDDAHEYRFIQPSAFSAAKK